jgi:hypothetical protein
MPVKTFPRFYKILGAPYKNVKLGFYCSWFVASAGFGDL